MHDLGRCRDRFCNTQDTAKINNPVKVENYGMDKLAPKISTSPRVQFSSGIILFLNVGKFTFVSSGNTVTLHLTLQYHLCKQFSNVYYSTFIPK